MILSILNRLSRVPEIEATQLRLHARMQPTASSLPAVRRDDASELHEGDAARRRAS